MGEIKQLSMLLMLTILIGIAGLALAHYVPAVLFMSGDVVVEEYHATLYLNGTLVEEYLYNIRVSDKYRMLYRLWEAPVSLENLSYPYVEVLGIEVPEGSVGYVKDYLGNVWASSYPEVINSLAEFNEVGCFNPSRFEAGKYRIKYVFRLHPPIEYDGRLCHLNLKFADEHLPYLKVIIEVENRDFIRGMYPHPPSLKVIDGDFLMLQGSSGRDELLEVELLLKPEVLDFLEGFIENSDDVEQATIQANMFNSIQYLFLETFRVAVKILVLVFPLILLFLYLRHGREKSFVVPKYLSYVPNRERRPWVVNLVFKSDALDFDENGFYATLLDLHRRGKIQITPKENGLIIRILDSNVEDYYERRVLRLLRKLSFRGVLDTDNLDILIEEFKRNRRELSSLIRDVRYVTRRPSFKIASKFMVSGRRRVGMLMALSAILLLISILLSLTLPYMILISLDTLLTSIALLIQSAVSTAAPSTLFGKWKGSAYKEKLEWDSFRRFLSDLAMIRRYAPQDLSIWGEWLVYGTSLGVGDKVVEAMKELKIPMIEANIAANMPLFFRPVIAIAPPSGKRGGRVGGGFGAGGGFGGGGAGAR